MGVASNTASLHFQKIFLLYLCVENAINKLLFTPPTQSICEPFAPPAGDFSHDHVEDLQTFNRAHLRPSTL